MNILHEDSCAYSFDRGTSNMSTNVSKEKREKLVEKIKAIKTYIATAEQDENTARLLTYIAEIEKDIKGKKYGLVFEEHRESIDEELENNLPVLVEDEPLFVDNGGQMNFLIEGDNLASLKLLEKTHKGKIDLIYIDPPYNTGNKDFVYDDAFVDTNDTFRHSKWLSFMEKRLEIAKNLLSENGAIFISIDDNEQSALKMLCDSIFGEKLTEQYIWCLQDKSEGSFVKTAGLTVRKEHEYIVACFKKSGKRFSRYAGKREFSEGSFSNPDNDPRGPWFSGNISRNGIKSTTGSKYYTITNPAGESFTRNWTLSKEEYDEALLDGRIFFAKGGAGVPRLKIYQNAEIYLIQSSLFNDVHTSITGKNELKALFGETPFNFPKPTTLIDRLMRVSCYKYSTILDFFAGSGTTGHAVMKLNAEDGGTRKFILCTNNENNICRDVTYERIKRVIDKEDYKASLKYFKVDFVPISEKLYYEYADELLKYVKQLVDLENAVNFNGNDKIAILLTEEELDGFANAIPESCKTIYLGHDVLPSEEQEKLFKKHGITLNVIPDYYYRDLEA